MCSGGGSKKIPDVQPVSAPPEPVDNTKTEQVRSVREAERRKVAAKKGQNSTILTSAQGLSNEDANLEKKTLLGK